MQHDHNMDYLNTCISIKEVKYDIPKLCPNIESVIDQFALKLDLYGNVPLKMLHVDLDPFESLTFFTYGNELYLCCWHHQNLEKYASTTLVCFFFLFWMFYLFSLYLFCICLYFSYICLVVFLCWVGIISRVIKSKTKGFRIHLR